MEVTDIQSKASVQGCIIPVMSGKKRPSTNMHGIISLAVMFLPEGVTESAKVFTNTQKSVTGELCK